MRTITNSAVPLVAVPLQLYRGIIILQLIVLVLQLATLMFWLPLKALFNVVYNQQKPALCYLSITKWQTDKVTQKRPGSEATVLHHAAHKDVERFTSPCRRVAARPEHPLHRPLLLTLTYHFHVGLFGPCPGLPGAWVSGFARVGVLAHTNTFQELSWELLLR